MINFSRKNTWGLIFTIIISTIIAAACIAEAVEVFDQDKSKSSTYLRLAGIIWQAAGFLMMLKPDFIKIRSDREGHARYEAIGFIVLGSILQGISAYFLL